MKAALATALALLAAPAIAANPVVPSFVDETAASGIDSVFAGEWEYMVGGGAAAFDCNDDGYADMLLPGGEKPATFYRNASVRAGPLRFVAEPSGLELTAVTGAYPLDIDADGRTDIAVLRNGENVLMRGLGGCHFERANEAWGFDGGDAWTAAFAATWEKGANWPTLAVGNYIDRKEEFSPWGSCTDNWLHRPGEEGRFAAPLALKPSFCPLSMLFTDWNRSGTPALRVANDREYYEGGQEQMWRMTPGEPPALYAKDEGWAYLRIWGMGIAEADLTGDGFPDYFLTSMADNRLQTLAAAPEDGKPRPTYKEIALAKGVTAHRPYTGDDMRPSTGWHPQFEDVNNDGRLDLFVAKGNVSEMPDFAMADPNNLLLQGEDGKFVEAGDRAGVASTLVSRGAALADFNLDGLVDLVVVNRNAPARLWRNAGPGGQWIEVQLRQDGSNRDAIGAFIEVTTPAGKVLREVTVGGGHAGGQLGWRHFGLGAANEATVRVQWPGGDWSAPMRIPATAFAVIARDKPEPVFWQPAR